MKELTTELSLEAPVARIWELLSDFALYPEWNPLFPKAKGSMNVGESFELDVQLPGIDRFAIRPTMEAVEQESRICWQSSMVSKGVLRWTFAIELIPDQSGKLRFVQRSEFKGVLAPLFAFAMTKPVAEGMEELNLAVKRWGEKGNVRCLRC